MGGNNELNDNDNDLSLSFNSLKNSKKLNNHDPRISALFCGAIVIQFIEISPKKLNKIKNHRCWCKGWLERFSDLLTDRSSQNGVKKISQKIPSNFLHRTTLIQYLLCFYQLSLAYLRPYIIFGGLDTQKTLQICGLALWPKIGKVYSILTITFPTKC